MKTILFLLFTLFTLQSNAQCWDKISSGAYHTIAIADNGTLWGWGYNLNGQVGNGTTTNQLSPVQIGTDTDWVYVGAGYYHSFAIKSNGTLWAWGLNTNRQLGDGTTTDKTSPFQVGTDTNWAKISGGEDFSVAIKTNGTLWTWGSNSQGQMGNGLSGVHLVPTQAGTETGWVQIDAGRQHAIALSTAGGVYLWGDGGNGQLGTGFTMDLHTPSLISGTSGVLKIDASARASAIILSDNSLWTTGLVASSNTYVFTKFQTANNWANLSSGFNHVIASKVDGTLWAWGLNSSLQCSNTNPLTFINSPVQVAGTSYSTNFSTNLYSSIALKTDGSLHTFGQNHVGQLAQGNLTNSIVTQVTCPSILSNDSFEIQNSVSIYPNPVSKILNISLENNSKIQNAAIYDANGKLIKNQNFNLTSIDVNDLASGLYFLQVTIDGKKEVTKFVKQ